MPVLPILSTAGRTLLRHWPQALAALAGALVVGGGVLLWAQHTIEREHAGRVAAELSLDSLEAVKDTTRLVQVRNLEDGLRLYQRRVVQTREVNDSLSRELEQETRSRTSMEVQIASLEAEVRASSSSDTLGVPEATFDVHEPPWRVWARVRMEDPPTLRLNIELDPIPIRVRIGCSDDVGDGVTPAYVNLTVPEWTRVDITETVQDPEVCNPGIFDPPSFWEGAGRPLKVGGAVVAGAGGLYLLYRTLSWIL